MFKNKIIYLLCFLFIGCGSKETKTLLTYPIQKGKFIESLTTDGELDARESVIINAPNPRMRGLNYYNTDFILNYLIEEGAQVKKGDIVAKLDGTTIQKELDTTIEKIDQKEDQIADFKADLESSLVSKSNRLTQLADELKLTKLNNKSLEFSPEIEKQKGRLKERQKEYDIQNQKEIIRKFSLDQKRKEDALLRNLKKLKTDKMNLRKVLEMTTLRATKNGLVVYERRNPYVKAKINVGDRLRRGQKILKIPNLDALVVNVELNEADIFKVKEGIRCRIELDAIPGKVYKGKVVRVNSIAHTKRDNQNIQAFDVTILLDAVEDGLLKPGMSVKVDMILNEYENVQSMPIDAIFGLEDRSKAKIYVREKQEIKALYVDIAERNIDFVVVKTQLPDDTEFVLYDPVIEETSFDPRQIKFERAKTVGSEKKAKGKKKKRNNEDQRNTVRRELKKGSKSKRAPKN